MEQMSDLFLEHRYYKFQNEIQFSLNTMMEHWNIAIQKAFVVAIGLLVAFSKSCIILLAWEIFANVMAKYIFTVFSDLFKSMGT